TAVLEIAADDRREQVDLLGEAAQLARQMLAQRGSGAPVLGRGTQVSSDQGQRLESKQGFGETGLVLEARRELPPLLQDGQRSVRHAVALKHPPPETERRAGGEEIALATLRERVDECAHALIVSARLLQALLARAIACGEVVPRRLRRHLSPVEVHRQLRGDFV